MTKVTKREKPKPSGWVLGDGEFIEKYHFNQLTRSNPPPIDYDTPVIPFGRFTGNGAWVM